LPDATPPAQAGSLTDVRGLRVGHFTETRRPTGCTVIIAPEGAVAGVDVRGAAPGTRETELLSPLNAVETVHAVMLAGGSAFGLDAAGGVMRWLDERGIGAKVGPARIPIVRRRSCLTCGLAMRRSGPMPRRAMPHARPRAASRLPKATSALVPARRSASCSASTARCAAGWAAHRFTVGGITVAALVAVNAIGDVIDPQTGEPIAGARSEDGKRLQGTMRSMLRGELLAPMQPGSATTLGIVATDAVLTKAQPTRWRRWRTTASRAASTRSTR